jgi:hypothetical protein
MIRDLFHDRDIYEGLHPMPALMHGWNNHSEMFRKLLGPDAKVVVEIGTWLGNSALHLCDAAPNAEIICIDTWLGALEMRGEKRDPDRFQRLQCRHGYPMIYYQFLSNVVHAGKQSRITPMPFPASIALRWLAQKSISPDLVYVDGSHDYEDVLADIKSTLELHPKIICGDDYQPGWIGVIQAVNELIPDVQVNADGFWWKILK